MNKWNSMLYGDKCWGGEEMVQGRDNEISDRVAKEGDKGERRGNRHREEGKFNKIKFENKHEGRWLTSPHSLKWLEHHNLIFLENYLEDKPCWV